MTTLAMPVPLAAGSMSTFILLIAVVIGFMFLVQRPMKKQQDAQRALQNSITEGARVMLTSGMFGTVTHLGEKQAIVELAPGLEVTVMRQAISKAVAPEDEEFEFSDSTVPGDAGDSYAGDAYAEDSYAGGTHTSESYATESYATEAASTHESHEGGPTLDGSFGGASVTGGSSAPQGSAATTHPDTADALSHGGELTTEQFGRDTLGHDNLGHDDLAHDDLAHDDLAHDDLAHDDLAHDDLAHDQVLHDHNRPAASDDEHR